MAEDQPVPHPDPEPSRAREVTKQQTGGKEKTRDVDQPDPPAKM